MLSLAELVAIVSVVGGYERRFFHQNRESSFLCHFLSRYCENLGDVLYVACRTMSLKSETQLFPSSKTDTRHRRASGPAGRFVSSTHLPLCGAL